MWFRDKSINRFPNRVFSYTAYGSSSYQVNCNNPYLSSSQATTLCGAAAGAAALVPLEVRYRLNVPYFNDSYVNTGLRATGGVRGKLGEAWTYDVGGVYIAKRYSLRLIANNLLDRNPPILANSYNISLARNNTIPARYDSLGRNIAIGVTTSF